MLELKPYLDEYKLNYELTTFPINTLRIVLVKWHDKYVFVINCCRV